MPAREIGSPTNALGYRWRTFQDLGDDPRTVSVLLACTGRLLTPLPGEESGHRSHEDEPRRLLAFTWAPDGWDALEYRGFIRASDDPAKPIKPAAANAFHNEGRQRTSLTRIRDDGEVREEFRLRCPKCKQRWPHRRAAVVRARVEKFAEAADAFPVSFLAENGVRVYVREPGEFVY